MGRGIAQVAAQAGYQVFLYDVEKAALDRAMDTVRANLEKAVSLSRIEPAAMDGALAALSTTTDLAVAASGADLVIESVPEVIELKREVLRAVETVVDPDALLATNTSSLSISGIATALRRPEKFIGLHFFNPVNIMSLVEVVVGGATGVEVVEQATGFVARIAKEPIVVADSPGFASSRLGVILGLEAMRMLEQGVASPVDIDKAMVLGYRHPMGPLRLTDLVGLDVRLRIAEYLFETLGSEAFRPPEILKRMVAEGRLGKKTGGGFFEWEV